MEIKLAFDYEEMDFGSDSSDSESGVVLVSSSVPKNAIVQSRKCLCRGIPEINLPEALELDFKQTEEVGESSNAAQKCNMTGGMILPAGIDKKGKGRELVPDNSDEIVAHVSSEDSHPFADDIDIRPEKRKEWEDRTWAGWESYVENRENFNFYTEIGANQISDSPNVSDNNGIEHTHKVGKKLLQPFASLEAVQEKLPPGREKRQDHLGRPYYVSINSGHTSRNNLLTASESHDEIGEYQNYFPEGHNESNRLANHNAADLAEMFISHGEDPGCSTAHENRVCQYCLSSDHEGSCLARNQEEPEETAWTKWGSFADESLDALDNHWLNYGNTARPSDKIHWDEPYHCDHILHHPRKVCFIFPHKETLDHQISEANETFERVCSALEKIKDTINNFRGVLDGTSKAFDTLVEAEGTITSELSKWLESIGQAKDKAENGEAAN